MLRWDRVAGVKSKQGQPNLAAHRGIDKTNVQSAVVLPTLPISPPVARDR